MEEMHQQIVAQMIEIAEGSAGLLHKICKPTAWRGRARAKHWQCDESVQNMEDKALEK